MRCHAFARKRPEHTHRVTVLKPWLCFLVNTIIRHSSQGSSQPHDHSFRCGGGLEGAPCSLPKVFPWEQPDAALRSPRVREMGIPWEMERAGLFWGENSSR